jgi:hypothetical protein
MTALVALGPLAVAPLIVWLLMEFGPERSVIFALWWIIPSIVFAVAMPLFRRGGRSRAQASARAVVVSLVITAVVFVGLLFGFTPRVGATTVPVVAREQQRPDTSVKTPPAGSATRTAILDGVRAKAGVTSRFKVSHVRATDRWAFVRCTEVVADGTQLQETDLDIAALLERRGAKWVVVDLWSLSTDDERPYTPFARRIRQRAKDARLPATLFPPGFLTSDVPVG